MSANLPSFYVSQFATNIMLLLQQKGSKLRPYVTEGAHIGKQASPVDQVGVVSMQPVTGRYQQIERVDATVTRRWVQPNDFDLAQLIDSFDQLRLLTDPQSVYVQNAVYAAGRQMDALILAAINGTNYVGETGTTSLTLPTTSQVLINADGSTTGLTTLKLRKANRLLRAANVDLDDPMNKACIVVNAEQHENILADTQAISRDFNNAGNQVPVLYEGKIAHFMGFDFIHSELVETTSTSVTYIPVFVKSGVHLGLWNDVVTDISQRKDIKGLPWQTYLKMTAGATRIEEGRVVQIACNHV